MSVCAFYLRSLDGRLRSPLEFPRQSSEACSTGALGPDAARTKAFWAATAARTLRVFDFEYCNTPGHCRAPDDVNL